MITKEELIGHGLELGGRQLRTSLGGIIPNPRTVFVKFVNLPEGAGSAGGGAEAQNNQMHFRWDEKPDGKVRLELLSSSLPREYGFRAKNAGRATALRFLAEFISKVVREVPPRFTHTEAP